MVSRLLSCAVLCYMNLSRILHHLDDKDLDVAISNAHIPLVLDMNKELEEKFGWTIGFKDVAKGYLQILPFGDDRKKQRLAYYC